MEQISYDENDNRREELATQLRADGSLRQGSGAYHYDRLNRLTWGRHPFETSGKAYAMDDAGNILSDGEYSYTYQANRIAARKFLANTTASFTYGVVRPPAPSRDPDNPLAQA